MDIQASKIELVKAILNIEDESLIDKLTHLLKSESPDIWDELTSEQQKEIEAGIEELNQGKRISYEEFKRKIS